MLSALGLARRGRVSSRSVVPLVSARSAAARLLPHGASRELSAAAAAKPKKTKSRWTFLKAEDSSYLPPPQQKKSAAGEVEHPVNGDGPEPKAKKAKAAKRKAHNDDQPSAATATTADETSDAPITKKAPTKPLSRKRQKGPEEPTFLAVSSPFPSPFDAVVREGEKTLTAADISSAMMIREKNAIKPKGSKAQTAVEKPSAAKGGKNSAVVAGDGRKPETALSRVLEKASELKSRTALTKALEEVASEVNNVAAVKRQLEVLAASSLPSGHAALTKLYGSLLGATYALRSDDIETLTSVWEDMYLRGIPNVKHFTSMMTAYIRAGEESRALLTYRRMRERGISPDIVTYNSLLRLIGVSLGRTDEALRVFGEMKSRGALTWPDVHTYSIMLEMLARHDVDDGQKGGASDGQKQPTNGHARSPAARAARSAEMASQLFEEMLRSGLVPNEVTYTSLVRALGRAGNLAGAALALSSAEQSAAAAKSPAPPAGAYHALMRAFGMAGDVEGARKIFERLRVAGGGNRPDSAAYVALMRAFTEAGDLGAVVEVFSDLRSGSVRPKPAAYSALMDALVLMENDPGAHVSGDVPLTAVQRLQRDWLEKAMDDGVFRVMDRTRGIADLRSFTGPGVIIPLRYHFVQLERAHRAKRPFHLPSRGLLLLLHLTQQERAAALQARIEAQSARLAESGVPLDGDTEEALSESKAAAEDVAASHEAVTAAGPESLQTPREVVVAALEGLGRPMKFTVSAETGAVAIPLTTLDRLFVEHPSAKQGPYPDTISRFIKLQDRYWSLLERYRNRVWSRGTSAYFF